MIPLRDSSAPRRLTPINSVLIVANLAVFAYELALGTNVADFVSRYAMIPGRVTASMRAFVALVSPQVLMQAMAPLATIVTSMFVHGGILHIAGNMLYLFIFGAAVEWRLGSRRFLFFYLASGIAAAIATILISPVSEVPVIGASGAIAGVLGAYFVFYPRARITTILPLFVFIQVVEVPAVLYLLLWFGVQLYAGLAEGSRGAMAGGVAWWAHIGGFLFGIALGPLLARAESSRRRVR
ncbi:MAG TPA: rhomboid family intramembrane serine protease [Candidatus Binataceae bacterium]|nr:rhomboid family intramembrane serine protease [Candidatus Binataceae bacterium]